MHHRTLAGVILVAAIAAAACSGAQGAASSTPVATAIVVFDPADVSNAVAAFVSALQEGDGAIACSYLRDDEQKLFLTNAKAIDRFRDAATSCQGLGGLEPGFVGVDESVDDLPLTNGLGSIQITRPTSVDASGAGGAQAPVPSDMLAWMVANPDLVLGPTARIQIAGHDGVVVEGTLSADADLDPTTAALRLTNDVILRPRHRFRLAVVSVEGRQLLIVTIAPADRFELFRPTSDAILASLELVAP